jgi:beta-fructofuranosidase
VWAFYPSTLAILEAEGYQVDASVVAGPTRQRKEDADGIVLYDYPPSEALAAAGPFAVPYRLSRDSVVRRGDSTIIEVPVSGHLMDFAPGGENVVLERYRLQRERLSTSGVEVSVFILFHLCLSVLFLSLCCQETYERIVMDSIIEKARQLRDALLQDPYRPRYHIVAPEGRCAPFDPNGALYWRGRYHLMYIVQTEKGHCWAHISSSDLLHWRHHPLALEPGGVDTGIFSGGAFIDQSGVPTITYWGLGDEAGICLATSTDDQLDHWTKSPHNPVIRQVGLGLATTDTGEPYGVADPSAIWVRDGRYYMLTGNLLVLREYGLKRGLEEHKGDTTYLFVSDDLAHWQYLHPFYTSDRRWTGEDEDDMCPDFFPLGDRHMLLFISHNLGCQYYIGRYEDDHFHPETHGRMTWADRAFFAPESLLDGLGRRIMWAWIFEGWDDATRDASAWSGTMSLPRVLWLGPDRTLRMAPAEELARLRYNPRRHKHLKMSAGSELSLPDVQGNGIELQIEMASNMATQYGVQVCCSPDGQERTLVYYDVAAQELAIDTTRASLGQGPRGVEGGPLELARGEPLRLRVFVDRSVVEVFANDRQAVMRRIYPTRADSLGVSLFSRGGPAQVASIDAYDISPTNPW